MTAAILFQHLQFRRAKRDAFIARPHGVMGCDHCHSISLATARHCHVGRAYNNMNAESCARRELRQFTTITSQLFSELCAHFEHVFADWVES